jgi:hypothetical protein
MTMSFSFYARISAMKGKGVVMKMKFSARHTHNFSGTADEF